MCVLVLVVWRYYIFGSPPLFMVAFDSISFIRLTLIKYYSEIEQCEEDEEIQAACTPHRNTLLHAVRASSSLCLLLLVSFGSVG